MTHALEKVARGETTRLIINIPPRHLKSICASVASAFLLGHDPTRKLICVSYTDDLAVFSNDCRAVMQSEWYKRTFRTVRSIGPRTPRPSSGRPNAAIAWRRPLVARSPVAEVTSSLSTTRSSLQDAQSEAIRNKTIQWYENTLLSRLDDKVRGAIVLVMQRLHLDDLAGHLLEKGGLNISSPGHRRTAGHHRTRIWPGACPQGRRRPRPRPRTAMLVEQVAGRYDAAQFSAEYQQRPIPLEGNIIKREWLRYFKGIFLGRPATTS